MGITAWRYRMRFQPYTFISMRSTLKSLVLIGAGVLAGIAGSIIAASAMRTAQVGDIIDSTGLTFEQCNGLDSAAKKNCVNTAVLNEAVRAQDSSICQSISDDVLKADCARRLTLIQSLGAEADDCQGLPANSVCADAMALLVAVDASDASRCNKISSVLLANTCAQMITGQRPAGADVVTASRSSYSYGLQCASSEDLCVTNKKAFNAAVRSQNVQLCADLEVGSGLCVEELLFFGAYQTGDYAACVKQFEGDIACRTTVAIAKAVDAGDEALCNSLAGTDREACQTIVRTNKEKRFEYLNEVF